MQPQRVRSLIQQLTHPKLERLRVALADLSAQVTTGLAGLEGRLRRIPIGPQALGLLGGAASSGGASASPRQFWLTSTIHGSTNIGGQFWFVGGGWLQTYPSTNRLEYCGFTSAPGGEHPRILSGACLWTMGHNGNKTGEVSFSASKLKGIAVRVVNALVSDEALLITVEKRNFGAWADLSGATVQATATDPAAFTEVNYSLVNGDTLAVRCDVDDYPTASLYEFLMLLEE